MQRIARAGSSASRVLQLRTARRGYATESDKLKLSLVLPHQAIYKSDGVVQVNMAAASGDMAVLANHVACIEPLKPGLLEVIESGGDQPKKWFVSGGFATVHPNNTLLINAVEAYPLDAFSPEAVRSGLAEAQRVAGGSGSEEEKAEASAEVDVFSALQSALYSCLVTMPPRSKKSASGSSASYSLDDKVLGRIKGYPPWPARIVDPEKEVYLPKAVRSAKPGKSQVFLVRFFGDGNYAWQKPEEMQPLSDRDIEDWLNADGKKKKAVHLEKAYKVAKNPEEWESEHRENMEASKKRDEEKAAGVDELESENEGAGDSKKRKRKEPAKKNAGKKAKKAPHSEDELAGKPAKKPKPTAAEEAAPGFKKCKEWRRELQKGFLSDSVPADTDMPKFDTMLKDIAEYQDKLDYLEANKLPKVIKRIAGLDNIPRDAEFRIKERAGAIVEQWTLAFAKGSNGNAEPSKKEVEETKKAIDGDVTLAGGEAVDTDKLNRSDETAKPVVEEASKEDATKMDVDEPTASADAAPEPVPAGAAEQQPSAPADGEATVLLNAGGEAVQPNGDAPPAQSVA